jgi:hypothetical protein
MDHCDGQTPKASSRECDRLSPSGQGLLQPVHILRRVKQGGGVACLSHTYRFHWPLEQPLVPRLVPPSLGGIILSTQDHGAPIPGLENTEMGAIAEMLEATQEDPTPLQKR